MSQSGYIQVDSVHWHTVPTMTASGTITVTRSSEDNENVTITGTITSQLASSSYYGKPWYATVPDHEHARWYYMDRKKW